jgi:hypothetical protein
MPPPDPKLSPSIEVRKVSIREFCEHLGIEDYTRFIGLQHMHDSKMIWLLLEKDDVATAVAHAPLPGTACSDCNPATGLKCGRCLQRLEETDMQTTGTAPQLASNTNYGKGGKTPKSGGKKKR